jgi:hypothetical protein
MKNDPKEYRTMNVQIVHITPSPAKMTKYHYINKD